jgi:hypothetical protein
VWWSPTAARDKNKAPSHHHYYHYYKCATLGRSVNDLTSVELSNLRRAATWACEFTTKQHIILSTAWEAFLLQLRSCKMLHFRISSGKADLLKMASLNRNKWALPTPRSREESSVRAALGIRLTWQQSGFCVRSAVGFVIKSQQSRESSFRDCFLWFSVSTLRKQ